MKGMMSKVLLLFALLSFFPFIGKAQDHFFSDQVVDDYFMAYDLNEKKEYIKAFDVLKKVEREMDNSLSQKGITVTDLHEDDFLMPYWTVKKSLGEVAYKLGLYKEMDACSKGWIYSANMFLRNRQIIILVLPIYIESQVILVFCKEYIWRQRHI